LFYFYCLQICVDQETLVLTTISWEARFQAAISRNDGAEVSFLLESIPDSVLLEGELRIRLDCSDPLKADYDWEIRTEQRSQDGLYGLVLDAVEIVIPSVRFLLVELGNACTSWIYQMIEEKIAKSHIFLQSYWHGTTQLVSLLARAGILYNNSRKLSLGGKTNLKQETEQAFHELVLRHCVRHTLPNFMGFYLDHHSLALDATSSVVMQAVVVIIPSDILEMRCILSFLIKS
jgi:spatacsin